MVKVIRDKKAVLERRVISLLFSPSHHLHRQSPGQLHPGWGSPSGSKDSGSGGYQ